MVLMLLLAVVGQGSQDCDSSSVCREGEYHPGKEPLCRPTGCLPFCSDSNSSKYSDRETRENETNVLLVHLNGHATYAASVFQQIQAVAAASQSVLLSAVPQDLSPFTQIWIHDTSAGSGGMNADKATFERLADWYIQRKQATGLGEIIADGRILSSGYAPGNPLVYRNYFYNLKRGGGGLVLGTDHDVFAHGINFACRRLGISDFTGNHPGPRMVVDDESPLMSYPSDVSKAASASETAVINGRTYDRVVQDHTSTGTSPANEQPNGMFFFAVGFHGGNINAPGISSTIRGSLNLQVALDIQCGECLKKDQFRAKASVTSDTQPPYRYSWRYRRLDDPAAVFVRATTSTDEMHVAHGLLVQSSPYLIEVTVTDSSPGVTVCRARVEKGDICLSGRLCGIRVVSI